MAEINLKGQTTQVSNSNDSIVIMKCLAEIQGGRGVKVGNSYPHNVINAGHVVVQDNTTKEYELLALNSAGTGYQMDTETTGTGQDEVTVDIFPEGKTAVGVVKATVLAEKPLVAILTQGQVNATASPFPVLDLVKAALPLVQFLSND